LNVRADLEGGRALKWYMKKAARGRKQDGAGSGELPIVGGVSGTGCGKRRFRESAEVLGAGNGGLGRVRRSWVRETEVWGECGGPGCGKRRFGESAEVLGAGKGWKAKACGAWESR